jgi:hypothetical protein
LGGPYERGQRGDKPDPSDVGGHRRLGGRWGFWVQGLKRHGGSPLYITALGRQRQEDHEVEVSLDYIVRCYLKKK